MRLLLLLVVFISGCYMAPYKTVPKNQISLLLVEVAQSVPAEDRDFLYALVSNRLDKNNIKHVLFTSLPGESRPEKLSNAVGADGHMTLRISNFGPHIEVYNFGVYDDKYGYLATNIISFDYFIVDSAVTEMVRLRVL